MHKLSVIIPAYNEEQTIGEVVERVPAVTRWANRFEPEITAKLLRAGYRIHEVPVSYRPRRADEGKKIGWGDGFAAIGTLLRCRLAPQGVIERRPGGEENARSA